LPNPVLTGSHPSYRHEEPASHLHYVEDKWHVRFRFDT